MKSVLDEDPQERAALLRKINLINLIGPLSIAAGLAISAAIYWWSIKR